MSPRCPVCRHDIRNVLRTPSPEVSNEPSRSVYPDQE
jgi:hypothetical protein